MALGTIRSVAFIGTGIMGAPIAAHILEAGYRLTVYTRTKSKAEDLLAKGAKWAKSPSDAARDADVVFTMLGYPDEVEEVYLTTDGLIRATKKGAYLIDLTTSSPQLARDLHDSAEIEDKHAFDIPVTGGQAGAQAGTLTLIAGATEKDIAPIRPVLETFSSKIYCFGGAGKGQIAKLANQVALASALLGESEAMALAEQGELDRNEVLDMISHGMGSSRQLEELTPKALAGDFKPGFKAVHLRKDLALALRLAEEEDLTLPGTDTVFNLFDVLCNIGGAQMGTQALQLLFEDDTQTQKAGLDWSLLDQADDSGDPDDEAAVHAAPEVSKKDVEAAEESPYLRSHH